MIPCHSEQYGVLSPPLQTTTQYTKCSWNKDLTFPGQKKWARQNNRRDILHKSQLHGFHPHWHSGGACTVRWCLLWHMYMYSSEHQSWKGFFFGLQFSENPTKITTDSFKTFLFWITAFLIYKCMLFWWTVNELIQSADQNTVAVVGDRPGLQIIYTNAVLRIKVLVCCFFWINFKVSLQLAQPNNNWNIFKKNHHSSFICLQ